MAWNDLLANQMVSFTDAQGGGFTLKSGQSAVTSNQCMNKTDALAKYNLDTASMNAYSALQLIPKSALSNILNGLTIFGAVAPSLSTINATIWYYVSSTYDGTQPYPLNKTWIQLSTQQTLPQCNGSILFGFIPMTPGQSLYIQIRNSSNTLLFQSQLGFKDTPSSNPCLNTLTPYYTNGFSYGAGASGNTNITLKLTDPITSVSAPANTLYSGVLTVGQGGTQVWGYTQIAYGSLVNPSIPLFGTNAIIESLYWASGILYFIIKDVPSTVPPTNWSTLTIGSTTYTKGQFLMVYSTTTLRWTFSLTTTNVFGTTSGVTRNIVIA